MGRPSATKVCWPLEGYRDADADDPVAMHSRLLTQSRPMSETIFIIRKISHMGTITI